MFKPTRKIVSEWYKIGKVFASVERIDDLLDRDAGGAGRAGRHRPAPALHRPACAFDRVTFAYRAEPGRHDAQPAAVLHDVAFEVEPGEVVLPRRAQRRRQEHDRPAGAPAVRPDDGTVLIDGIDMRRLHPRVAARSGRAWSCRTPSCSAGRVAENIGYGMDDADQEQIERAARAANAHDFIEHLPRRLRHRARRARGEPVRWSAAAHRDRPGLHPRDRRSSCSTSRPPGWTASRPTSSWRPSRSLMRGKTTIIISHDPGLIRCADRIMVLSDGRIVESGGHQELISARGLYSELYIRELEPELPHTNGDGNGSHEDGWAPADSDYVIVTPRRAQPVYGGE